MTPRELAHASGAELRRLREVLRGFGPTFTPTEDEDWAMEIASGQWSHILESIGEDAARAAFFAGLRGEGVPEPDYCETCGYKPALTSQRHHKGCPLDVPTGTGGES